MTTAPSAASVCTVWSIGLAVMVTVVGMAQQRTLFKTTGEKIPLNNRA